MGLFASELGGANIHMGLDSFKELMRGDLKKVTAGFIII